MPQVDLSSVCAGGVSQDRKVSCETLAGAGDDPPSPAEDLPTTPPQLDYAPESFWLSKDAELDWFDRNAFIERKDSGKGSTNTNTNTNSISGSQRYSVNLKPKTSIIGLPKPQKTNYADRRICRRGSIRLFPKRSEPGRVGGGKPVVAFSEPSSPKVSCMGRVRSRKDRSRRGKKNRMKQTEPDFVKSRTIKERKKTGFWTNLKVLFRSKGNKTGCKGNEQGVEPVSVSKKKRGFDFNNGGSSEINPVHVPGLGGVKRFASGRRSDAWAVDLLVHGAKSEPLDRRPIWQRRERGPPVDVDVDRDWQSVGPASV